jgi:hypothetical protein
VRARLLIRAGVALIMPALGKDEILTIVSILILVFTALITWTVMSYLILLAVVLLILAWYFKG